MIIKFIERTHQYFSEDNRELVSVSKFMKSFKKEEDWDAIAAKSALKKTREGNPTTKQELLKKWKRKRDISAEVGTRYHAIREQELIDQNQPVFYNVPCEKKQCDRDESYKYSIPINHLENNTVYTELMIYDEEYMICGQADKVIVVGNRINIWDYKTDAEIKFNAYSSEWVAAKKFLPPIDQVEECNGNEYSLKMSMYLYMLWRNNKGRMKPGDLIIEHIHLKRDPDNDNIPVMDNGVPIVERIDIIKLPYLKKEVMEMLKTIKKK